MTDEIQPDRRYDEGESARWEHTITESDGSVKQLSGAIVSWMLVPNQGDPESDALLSDDDGGVTVQVIDADAGRVDVTIDAGETDGLGGRTLWQRLIIEDSSGGLQVWSGDFPIEER